MGQSSAPLLGRLPPDAVEPQIPQYRSLVTRRNRPGADAAESNLVILTDALGGTRRAIDIREGEPVNARAFKAFIKAAVAANGK